MAGSPLVVIAGPPGSGKGTQCARLGEQLGFSHVSTGDALRDEIERGTRMGRHVRAWVNSGRLVPDRVAVEVVLDRLDTQPEAPAALLDGFPRTVAQGEALEHLRPGAVELAIALVVPRATLVRRLALRNRDDDHSRALGCRLAAFEQETRPMLAWFAARGLLVEVDGDQPDAASAALVARLMAGICAASEA